MITFPWKIIDDLFMVVVNSAITIYGLFIYYYLLLYVDVL